MKSLIKMLWVLTLALTINPLFASDNDPSWKLEPMGAKSFAVYLDFPVECTAHIRIKDTKGITVLKKRYRNVTNLSRKINLVNLPDGTYFVEVEDRMKIHAFTIEMAGERLNIKRRPEKDYFKPLFVQKGKYVDMCMLLLPEKEATVSVFSSEGRLVMQQFIKDQNTIEKRFNVSGLQKGTYSFVVSTGEKTFAQSLSIK
ncbi:MAG: T9SS type A sorting domain-containing protein [Bacteroidota bacterium]